MIYDSILDFAVIVKRFVITDLKKCSINKGYNDYDYDGIIMMVLFIYYYFTLFSHVKCSMCYAVHILHICAIYI